MSREEEGGYGWVIGNRERRKKLSCKFGRGKSLTYRKKGEEVEGCGLGGEKKL
jgi:hypothetical protein